MRERRDSFDARMDKRAALKRAEENGEVVDSIEFRKGLMDRVRAGEITITQAQDLLQKEKRKAKKLGKLTRTQVWNRS